MQNRFYFVEMYLVVNVEKGNRIEFVAANLKRKRQPHRRRQIFQYTTKELQNDNKKREHYKRHANI